MEQILSLTWYVDSPLDSEYKEYLLFSYLQKVDLDFHNNNDKIIYSDNQSRQK
jgi:hypothetical protein